VANEQASATLDRMIEQLRSVPRLVEDALPAAAKECHRLIGENIAAQRGPDGEPWPKSKLGDRVLVGALKAVTAAVIGNVILIKLVGPEARHHLGIAKGHVVRRILPTRRKPQPMTEAIRRVILRSLSGGVGK
jgi:hypothetical protein